MSVSTPVKTLAVNPAFLQEIKDSHAPFWEAWDQLALCLLSSDNQSRPIRRLCGILNELRDLMAVQFALEEFYGYLEVPVGLASPHNHLLQDIRSQHCGLYLELNDLTEQTEELLYRGCSAESAEALLADLRQFVLRFRDHERLESDMIACAQAARQPW